eukprot:CFRG6192T1
MNPVCPVCRTELNPGDIRPSLFMQRQILNLQVRCGTKAESEDDAESGDHEGNKSLSPARRAPIEDTTEEPSNANPKADDMFSLAGTTESSLGSCDEQMTVKEMLIHEGTCTFARVMCPAGCGHRVVRANIDDHLQEKAGTHIRALCEHNKKLNERINELLAEMRKVLAEMRKMLDDTCLENVGLIVNKPVTISRLSFPSEIGVEINKIFSLSRKLDDCPTTAVSKFSSRSRSGSPFGRLEVSNTLKGLVLKNSAPGTIGALSDALYVHFQNFKSAGEEMEDQIEKIGYQNSYVVPRNVQSLTIPSTYDEADCLDVLPKLYRLQKMTEMHICCTLVEAELDIPPVPSVRVLWTDDLVWTKSVFSTVGRAFPELEVLVVTSVDVDIKDRVDRGSFASLQKLKLCKLPKGLTHTFS